MAETLDTTWALHRGWRIVVVGGAQLWPGSTASLLPNGLKDATKTELLHAGHKDASHGGEIPPAAVGRRRRRLPGAVRLVRPTHDLDPLLLSHFKIESLHGRAAASWLSILKLVLKCVSNIIVLL